MNYRNIPTTIVCVLVACGMIFMASSQAKAQVTYRLTGTLSNAFTVPEQLGPGESFTADFVIDVSAVDRDPSPDYGSYDGAILSSTIEFSGGYTSTVDFSGGDVDVEEVLVDQRIYKFMRLKADNIPGSSVDGFFWLWLDPVGDDVDALITSSIAPGVSAAGLFTLNEIDGSTIGGFLIPEEVPMSLAVIAEAPETLLGDVNQTIDFLDIAPFIELLRTFEFLDEADLNGDGAVNFLDITPFVALLNSQGI